ncbi:hypothetical protein [Flavobacterium sp.]|uniref:hypothetical protein n=1 Tax=Flavobacterium sp. TaxID=239 RepID=UPI0031CEE640
MKLKLLMSLLGIMLLSLVSCDNDKISPRKEGDWDDNIKLSKKEFNISSSSSTVTVFTENDGWWLNGIRLNNESVDLTKMNLLSKNFVITKSEFQVERKDGKTIIITMNQNTTNADRVLYVSLQNGDYFDGVAVIQSK